MNVPPAAQPPFPEGPPGRRCFALAGGLIGAAGLILQGWLAYRGYFAKGLGWGAATAKFFSYFTVLTNTLVTFGYWVELLPRGTRVARFFAQGSVRSAIMLYIAVVGIVYAAVLARLWDPQGAQLIADRILHYVTPALYVVFWICCVPKGRLEWKLMVTWLLYPAIYLGWMLGRGAVTHDYPYHFLDAGQLGYPGALDNAALLLVVFMLGGAAVIGLNRVLARAPLK